MDSPQWKLTPACKFQGKWISRGKKNVLGSCKSGWKQPSVCKEIWVQDLVQLLSSGSQTRWTEFKGKGLSIDLVGNRASSSSYKEPQGHKRKSKHLSSSWERGRWKRLVQISGILSILVSILFLERTIFQNAHSHLLICFLTKPRGLGQEGIYRHILQCC